MNFFQYIEKCMGQIILFTFCPAILLSVASYSSAKAQTTVGVNCPSATDVSDFLARGISDDVGTVTVLPIMGTCTSGNALNRREYTFPEVAFFNNLTSVNIYTNGQNNVSTNSDIGVVYRVGANVEIVQSTSNRETRFLSDRVLGFVTSFSEDLDATVVFRVDGRTFTHPIRKSANSHTIESVTVVEERFGSFELVVQSPTGLNTGTAFSYVSDIAEIDGLNVVAGSGESRTRIDQLLNGSYEITQTVPEGWRLESVSCSGDTDGGTVVDLVTGKIDLDLDTGESITCVIENTRDDAAIRLATQRAIRNFMARRGDRLLETAPDLSRRFSDRQSREGGSFSANGSALQEQMDFRTSLAGFRNRAASEAVGDNRALTKPVMKGWDIWMSAEYSRVEDERVGSGVDAKFFSAQLGADYQVKDNLLVGALVQYDWMNEHDDELAEGVGAVAGAEVEGDGFMVGPYVVWQATDTLVLDAMGLWGTSENTVNPLGNYEDQFDTTRFMLQANATGEFKHGLWTVRPQLTWSHYEDQQDAYIDTLGIDIPSQTVSIGRLRAGPEVTWTQELDEGAQLELGATIRANWDYDGPGLLNKTGRLSNGGSDLRADGDLLLGLRFTNGASLHARVGVDGIGQGDFSARSLRLELNFPFGGKGAAGSSSGVADLSGANSLMSGNELGLEGWQQQNGLGNDRHTLQSADLLQQRVMAAR